MKLEEIGFYSLSDDRAKNVSQTSPLKRCEILLTDRCNFNCTYCRGLKPEYKGDVSLNYAELALVGWIQHNLENVRFSGGEPTLHPYLRSLVAIAKNGGIKQIAISTNGSAKLERYKELIDIGVTDFSISLDSCCAADCDKMAGGNSVFHNVVNNIRELSKLVYVTVGVVINENNIEKLEDTIMFVHDLGVADIRIISAAQYNKLEQLTLPEEVLNSHPILKYRINNLLSNRGVRGITKDDNPRCPLVLDDMAVVQNHHYPCIIHLREQGDPIGSTVKSMSDVRQERYDWYKNTNCFENPICRKNCLDVCVDYNNKVRELNLSER